MRIEVFLAVVLSVGAYSDLHADEYPVPGVWAEVDQPPHSDVTASCESYLKNPKSPTGHIVIFKGSKRVDFNGGYLEREAVNNIAVRKDGPDEFLVTDSYYDDGDGEGRPGIKRRSYKLRLLAPDKIETKEAKYPSSTFVRCLAARPLTGSNQSEQTKSVPGQADAEYGVRVVEDLQKFKQYPATAKERHAEGRAVVKFTVDREGKISSSNISVSSGSADLDQKALAMLIRAQPLPSFPAGVADKAKTYSLPVIFNSIEARRQEPGTEGLAKKVGQCVETSILAITDRSGKKLSPSPSKDGFDPGTAIKYANGGFQISYDKGAAIGRSTIGDKVKMCLVEIPRDCPPGDDRGRVYDTRNLRTGEAWTLADAQHRCGGA
jgi:TonB family protein